MEIREIRGLCKRITLKFKPKVSLMQVKMDTANVCKDQQAGEMPGNANGAVQRGLADLTAARSGPSTVPEVPLEPTEQSIQGITKDADRIQSKQSPQPSKRRRRRPSGKASKGPIATRELIRMVSENVSLWSKNLGKAMLIRSHRRMMSCRCTCGHATKKSGQKGQKRGLKGLNKSSRASSKQ